MSNQATAKKVDAQASEAKTPAQAYIEKYELVGNYNRTFPTREELQKKHVLHGRWNKSASMRELESLNMSRGDISKVIGCSYQQVRNSLERPISNPTGSGKTATAATA